MKTFYLITLLALIVIFSILFLEYTNSTPTGNIILKNKKQTFLDCNIKKINNYTELLKNCSNLTLVYPENKSMYIDIQSQWESCYFSYLNATYNLYIKTNISQTDFKKSTQNFVNSNKNFAKFFNKMKNKCISFFFLNKNLLKNRGYKTKKLLFKINKTYSYYSYLFKSWLEKLKPHGFKINCQNKTLTNDTLCHRKCNNSICKLDEYCINQTCKADL